MNTLREGSIVRLTEYGESIWKDIFPAPMNASMPQKWKIVEDDGSHVPYRLRALEYDHAVFRGDAPEMWAKKISVMPWAPMLTFSEQVDMLMEDLL